MRTVLLAALVSSMALAAAPWRGRAVTYEETDVTLADALRTIADLGHTNVVLLAPGDQRLPVSITDTPWDQALSELVSKQGLALRREGDVFIVATPEVIAQRKGGRFTAKRVRLASTGAGAEDLSSALARACRCNPGALTGGEPVHLALRNVPADQLLALVRDVSHATSAKPKPATKGCAAEKSSVKDLTTRAVVTGTAAPTAVLTDKNGGSFVVGLKDCVGSEQATVKRVTLDEVTLSTGVDLMLGGGVLPSDRARTRAVPIDDSIALIDSFSPETFRGHRKAIERKRALLVFLRDALKLEVFEEDVSRTANEMLWNVPPSLAAQVDDAIARGATATPELLASPPDVPALHSAALYEVWRARELKAADYAALLEAAVKRFEDDAAELLALQSQLEGKKVKVLDAPVPPSLHWLLTNTAAQPKLQDRVQTVMKRYAPPTPP